MAAFQRGFACDSSRLFLPLLGYAQARAGQHAAAQSILTQLRALYQARVVSPYHIAQLHLALGRRDSALAWLETAHKEGLGHVVWLDAGYQWAPLRGEPRFEALREKVGLK